MNGSRENASVMRQLLVLAVPLILGVAGCSEQSTSPRTATLVRITPADGATQVSAESPVTLEFAAALERTTVEAGFHLIADWDTSQSCPDWNMGRHGSMDSMMGDRTSMQHMDRYHSTAGAFHWNSAGTVCTFTPSSPMLSQTRYMVHLGAGMVRNGQPMMGGMMNPSGDMFVHFRTLAVSQP
jgi:Big-like domain-containing protein